MGIDTNIYLAPNVRAKDVSQLIGVLVGAKHNGPSIGPVLERDERGQSKDVFFKVDGVKVEPCHSTLPTCAYVTIQHLNEAAAEVRGCTAIQWMYHFECNRKGMRLMMPRMCNSSIVIGRRLVDFFGGEVDYNDCDAVKVDYSQPWKSDAENCPEDGEEYWNLYRRMAAEKPITKEEYQKG